MINFEGGAHPRRVPDRIRHRPRRNDGHHLDGADDGLRALPHAQIRPDLAEGVLSILRLLQQRGRSRTGRARGNAAPILPLPTEEQKAEQQRLTGAIQDLTDALSDKKVAPLKQEWEKTLSGTRRRSRPSRKSCRIIELDGSLADSSGHYRQGRTLNGDPTFGGGMVSRAVSLDGQTMLSFGERGAFDADDNSHSRSGCAPA